MQDFHKLQIWERSHGLVLAVYRVTRCFPKDELYGLTNQIRRASVSIPTNIAEGCGRGGNTDFARFLHISMGSACELEFLLQLARELDYIHDQEYTSLIREIREVKQMLTSFIQLVKSGRSKS